MFTDACPQGIGGFVYEGPDDNWRTSAHLLADEDIFAPPAAQASTYGATVPPFAPYEQPSARRTAVHAPALPVVQVVSYGTAVPLSAPPEQPSARHTIVHAPAPHEDSLHEENPTPATLPVTKHINVTELRAILEGLRRWAKRFSHGHLVVSTDKMTAFHGLQGQRLLGKAHAPLRSILSLAAAENITIEPHWLSSEANALADALSRRDWELVANLPSQSPSC